MKNNIRKKILLLGLIESTILLSGCKSKEEIDNLIKPFINVETSNLDDTKKDESNYDFDEIKKIIDNNNDLGENEKNFIKNLKFFFDENYKYMDIDMIKERLSTLKINYIESEYGTSSGYYNPILNEIIFFQQVVLKVLILIHLFMNFYTFFKKYLMILLLN